MKADAHVDGISDDFSINKRLEHARAKLESSRNNSAMRRVEQLLKMAMGRDEDSEDLSFQRAMNQERYRSFRTVRRASQNCVVRFAQVRNLYNLANRTQALANAEARFGAGGGRLGES